MTASLPGFAVAWRSGITSIQSMRALRPAAKTGIVVGGFLAALAAAWATMNLRQTLNAADPVQGMQAFGDRILGVAVFSVLASIPVGLGLYWLRPVTWFWNILLIVAFTCSATGPAALLISWPLRAALGSGKPSTDSSSEKLASHSSSGRPARCSVNGRYLLMPP